MEILSHASAKKEEEKTKRLKDFKFRTFMGQSFSDDIMAVKGLRPGNSGEEGGMLYCGPVIWLVCSFSERRPQ